MIQLKFVPVAEVEGVCIHAPADGFISYFNSPYYGHQNATALDIYSNHRDYDVAFSPVAGRVLKIHTFTPPRKAFLRRHDPEQLIILSSRGLRPHYIRLLHIHSTVNVGDRLAVGDELGSLVRSGFFNYWTDPHIHIDVRRHGNLLRAKGSLPITRLPFGRPQTGTSASAASATHDLSIIAVKREYILSETPQTSRMSGFYGLRCTVDSTSGLLDAGLPHYSYGGVHLIDANSIRPGSLVHLDSQVIGAVVHVTPHYAIFQAQPLHVSLNGQRVHGLSLYLYLNNHRLLKIIPSTAHPLPCVEGGRAQLSIQAAPASGPVSTRSR